MPRLHVPTIVGRLRSDPGLLVLLGLVVALTVALVAAVGPLTDRAADRAVAATVDAAGSRGDVVATMPRGYDDPTGTTREPRADLEVRQDARYARFELPRRLAAVLRPGVSTVTTPSLHLLDAGPGRYLRLAYVEAATGPPSVRFTAGSAPAATVPAGRANLTVRAADQPWPVQVALSRATAAALGLGPGDRVPAEDEQHRRFTIRVSGVYEAADAGEDAWQLLPELLQPTQGLSDGVATTSAAALVTAASLPDLRVAVPADDLTQRVVFAPRPDRLRWRASAEVQQAVRSLQATGDPDRDIVWDSLLVSVLDEARAEVASARGQADVLLVGLLAGALLVLVLATQLLVRRRAGSIVLARERGASLLGLGAELAAEILLVAAVAAGVGLAVAWVLAGSVDGSRALGVLAVPVLAAPVWGMVAARSATDARRVPANRAARRAAARVRAARRVVLEGAVLAVAVLSFVALRQRGVASTGGEDLTAASAGLWWAVAGALALGRLLPPAARVLLRSARGRPGETGFLLASRLVGTAGRLLPLLVVTVAVAQLTLGVTLVTTEHREQVLGARQAVGGDARLTTPPAASVDDTARAVAQDPDVRAVATGRIADDVRASAAHTAQAVRLVVVAAADYRRLLVAGGLPDAPGLALLGSGSGGRVPALLVGGDPRLRDGLVLDWAGTTVPLDVVGTAPRVDGASGPVVLVDARDLARTGAVAEPDTVWAVGPGAVGALEAVAGPAGEVVGFADVLAARRDAPLPSGLVRLALASAALLLCFALLGVALAAAVGTGERAESLGRLRALGLPDPDLRRVLAGELLVPAVAAALAGLALGLGGARAMIGSLALELVTGAAGRPGLVVAWWLPVVVLALVGAALTVTAVEWRSLRRRTLAQLLRG